jgi:hypothetical protein
MRVVKECSPPKAEGPTNSQLAAAYRWQSQLQIDAICRCHLLKILDVNGRWQRRPQTPDTDRPLPPMPCSAIIHHRRALGPQ